MNQGAEFSEDRKYGNYIPVGTGWKNTALARLAYYFQNEDLGTILGIPKCLKYAKILFGHPCHRLQCYHRCTLSFQFLCS